MPRSSVIVKNSVAADQCLQSTYRMCFEKCGVGHSLYFTRLPEWILEILLNERNLATVQSLFKEVLYVNIASKQNRRREELWNTREMRGKTYKIMGKLPKTFRTVICKFVRLFGGKFDPFILHPPCFMRVSFLINPENSPSQVTSRWYSWSCF